MALLRSLVPQSGTTAASASAQSIGRYTAPANQKVVVWPTIHFKDTSGSPVYIQTELRRGTTGGTLDTEISPIKASGTDAEDVQGQYQPYTVQPNNDGSVIDRADIRSDRSWAFPPITLNGGEAIDIFLTNANAKAYTLVIKAEE